MNNNIVNSTDIWQPAFLDKLRIIDKIKIKEKV